MAAFHFYLNRKIAGLPAEHVNLYGSEYNTSFVDVSQHWDELKGGPTVLSAIVSDFTNLRQLSSAKVAACVLEDLRRFIPGLSQDDVARVHTQLNVTKPLFVNTVGAWSFRPRAKTRIPNLYIAGDYCRTEADLTTMESAAISGRQTAAQILNDKGMEAAAREAAPRQLEKRSERSFRGLWWLLLPFAGCAWLARSLDSKRGRLLG
jgi:hypothetical protein